MRTEYEWCIEYLEEGAAPEDDDADIVDQDFRDNLKEFKALPDGEPYRLVLVRNVGDDSQWLKERAWAYVTEFGLPEHFDDGNKVPKYYREEYERFMAASAKT